MSENQNPHQQTGKIPPEVRRPVLWNTHAAFPTSHLIDRDELGLPEGLSQAGVAMPSHNQPAITPAPETGAVAVDLSPYAAWLLECKPPVVGGSFLERPATLPVIPVLPATETPESSSGRKKKKKKKKKKAKTLHKKADKNEVIGALDASIVTDTLAEVASRQGFTREAITMYRKLVSLHPERAAFYLERIQALKDDLSEE